MADEDSVVPLESMNVVVLGDPKVGKTSLITRYLGGESINNEILKILMGCQCQNGTLFLVYYVQSLLVYCIVTLIFLCKYM